MKMSHQVAVLDRFLSRLLIVQVRGLVSFESYKKTHDLSVFVKKDGMQHIFIIFLHLYLTPPPCVYVRYFSVFRSLLLTGFACNLQAISLEIIPSQSVGHIPLVQSLGNMCP
jgi:hypothetical protein